MTDRCLPLIVYVLENFWLNNSERLDLDKDIVIRLSYEEEQKDIEKFPRSSFMLSRNCFLMEFYMDNSGSRIDQWPLWSGLFALRLVKPGGVGYNKPLVNPRGYIMTGWRADDVSNTFLLESEDIPTVQTIYGQLLKAKRDLQFQNILRRFNASYNGPFYKRLEDLMAALEALLIFDMKVRAKNSTIQQRLERLLDTETEDLNIMRNTMNVAYGARNCILHEARILDTELLKEVCGELGMPIIHVFNLLSAVEEYARLAIRKWGAMLADERYLNSSTIRKSLYGDS